MNITYHFKELYLRGGTVYRSFTEEMSRKAKVSGPSERQLQGSGVTWILRLGCCSFSAEEGRRWRSCRLLVGPSGGCIQTSATF